MVHGEYKVPGGKLVVVDLALRNGELFEVQISGDFFLEPDTALVQMNQALEGLPADAGEAAFAAAVDTVLSRVQTFGLTADGVAVAVTRALQAEATA